jgi:chemotaxis protein CheY-P-specific phosphatase CheC
MADDRLETVETTFLDVVEKLTFMFGEQAEKDEIEVGEEPWIEARMRFTGGQEGSLAVIVPRSLQPEIAANILGLDAEGLETQEVLDDALREMLNVVCGHALMELCGGGRDFVLETPTNVELDDEALGALLAQDRCSAYLLDDEPVLLHLELA